MTKLSAEAIIALCAFLFMLCPTLAFIFRWVRRRWTVLQYMSKSRSNHQPRPPKTQDNTTTGESAHLQEHALQNSQSVAHAPYRVQSLPVYGMEPRIEAGTLYYEVGKPREDSSG